MKGIFYFFCSTFETHKAYQKNNFSFLMKNFLDVPSVYFSKKDKLKKGKTD